MSKEYHIEILPVGSVEDAKEIKNVVSKFAKLLQPIEDSLFVHVDMMTDARYCECHINASLLIESLQNSKGSCKLRQHVR